MDLLLETYKLLRNIRRNKTDSFSGIGLVVYDENIFDSDLHCDLRPEVECPHYSVVDDELCNYLIKICEYYHTLHDGFHMINSQGYLTHIAQYFVPPVIKELQPNREHGVRLYSSMCGSLLDGVLFIGTISSNNDIYIFQNGDYVDLDKMEMKIAYESQETLI